MKRERRRRTRPETRSSRGMQTTTALLFGPPPILPGEDATAYEELLGRMTSAVNPRDIFEEIWIRDVADLQWDILRYRRLIVHFISSGVSARVLGVLRNKFTFPGETDAEDKRAKEGEDADSLESVDDDETSAEGPMDSKDEERSSEEAGKLAGAWTRRDPDTVEEVDRLLKLINLTIDDLIEPVVLENLDKIERIEHLIEIGEVRRNAALRELDRHRSTFAQAVRGTIHQIEVDEPQVVVPKTIERIGARR